MTTIELAELILARLYDLAESQGHGEQFDVKAIAREFGETDYGKVASAAKVLESRGWITPHFIYPDGIYAFLTGDGAVAVEQEGGATGFIRAFRRDPQRFFVSVVDQSIHYHDRISNSNIASHSPVGSQSVTSSTVAPEVFVLLDRISHQLTQDAELAEARRRELLDDVRTLRAELQRPIPRMGILGTILSTFADVATLSGFVIQLRQYLQV